MNNAILRSMVSAFTFLFAWLTVVLRLAPVVAPTKLRPVRLPERAPSSVRRGVTEVRTDLVSQFVRQRAGLPLVENLALNVHLAKDA